MPHISIIFHCRNSSFCRQTLIKFYSLNFPEFTAQLHCRGGLRSKHNSFKVHSIATLEFEISYQKVPTNSLHYVAFFALISCVFHRKKSATRCTPTRVKTTELRLLDKLNLFVFVTVGVKPALLIKTLENLNWKCRNADFFFKQTESDDIEKNLKILSWF